MTRHLRWGWARVGVYGVLIAFAAFYLMPAYVVLVNALKPFPEVSLMKMWDLPAEGLSFEAFQKGWDHVSPNFIASLKITVPTALISSFIGSINGYIFAKWRFKGSNVVFLMVLFGLFLPYQGILIPLVQVLVKLGIYGSIVGVIVSHSIFGIPITALIFRGYFVSVPTDLVEAARIDGAGFFGVYRYIMFPIAAPAFAVVLIWQFTQVWNDFLLALIILSNPKDAPVMVAVNNVANSYFVEYNVQFAAALIASAPTLLIYFALGKLFMRGLLAGAVKG
ncbi:MAG TPA: carbohydrate ABC transporter permease [Chloroflexota bacterium]|nr:carbohydrate ABC transporter permease [Chloroflexota bacterium]